MVLVSPPNNNDDDSEVMKLLSRGNDNNNNNGGRGSANTAANNANHNNHNHNNKESSGDLWFKLFKKQSMTRLIVLQIILMYGCYHLGKYAWEEENYAENNNGNGGAAMADVISKKSKPSPPPSPPTPPPSPTTTTNTKSNNEQQEQEQQNEKEEKKKKKQKDKEEENKYALTYNKLKAIQTEALDVITMLDEYYSKHNGGPSSILLGNKGWAFGWNYNDTLDLNYDQTIDLLPNREEKLIDTMGRALLDKKQSKFIIGSIGSSVAAGHDNCRYDNYQEQLERTWSRVWDAAGMTLEVQNAGQGGGCGDSHRNQVYCITQNVSPYIDIVHYVWTYFENPPGINERESLVRWTQILDKAPPVHVINVGAFNECLSKNKKDEDRIMEYYTEYGYNAYCMRYALKNSQHYEARDKAKKPKNKDQYGLLENGHVGDGFHNTTRYGENENNQLRKDSLGVVMRNWHPGPLGFQIISDALIYTYTKALLVALTRIENTLTTYSKNYPNEPVDIFHYDPNGNTPDSKKWLNEQRKIVIGSKQMKPPLVCNPKYCFVDEPPKCKNFELPTFGYYGASIATEDDDLNPYIDTNVVPQKWEPYILDKGWDNMIDKVDASIYQDTPEFCSFPDHCAGMLASSSTDNGRIVFKLPKMDVGMVSICFCCGKGVAKQQLLENEYVEIMFNDVVLTDRTKWDLFPEKKCVRIIDDHTGLVVGPTGHAYLSVRILEGNTQNVIISHIITL